jgi:hypothetical protein
VAKENIERTEKQVRLWKYAAWTLPFVALSAIVFIHFVGFNDWLDKTIVMTATLFFAISVFWWWWALHKLVDVLKGLEAASKGLQSLKASINDFKKYLQDSDDSDR